MSLLVRKSVFGVSDQVMLQPANSARIYNTFQQANNKGADQTAQMCRLVCTFVVSNPSKTGFLASWPYKHNPERKIENIL